MFNPRLTKPETGNKYYNRTQEGGYAVGAIFGSPTVKGLNILANCVGYAAGRFNEIIGAGVWKYLTYPPDPDQWIARAQAEGLRIGSEPQLGAVLVWGHHVAIVEEINADGTIVTSESGYGCSNPFWLTTRNNNDGCWNGAGYNGFKGFIYQPKEVQPMNGIDVSVHNGDIDWGKVKADGIGFAILRAGYGRLASQKDEKFEQNYAGAKAAGIPAGAYWYSYAMTPEEAELEADVFLSVIKGKQFEMPVYFDLEEKKQFDLGKEQVSAIMRAFLKKVEGAGYFVGLYGSASSLTTHTTDDIKSWYTIWLAHWVDQTNYSGAYGIWQHSEKGKVAGINGNVDLDICYKDFPTIIKGKGLNGYGAPAEQNPAADQKQDSINVKVEIGGAVYEGPLIRTDA